LLHRVHLSVFWLLASDHDFLDILVAGGFGEQASEGAAGLQRRDEEDQQGGRRVEADSRREESDCRGQGPAEGGQDPVNGKASSVMWLLLKQWMPERVPIFLLCCFIVG
jgi:hypothetical protein